jgi:hypothetical protein
LLSSKKNVALGIGTLSVLLSAGVAFAPAAGAAVNNDAAHGNSAFALSAAGLLKIAPIPSVNDSEGFAQKSVAKFATPGGAVTANVLNAQAGAGQARASILDVSVNLSLLSGTLTKPLLTATAIEAKCEDGKVSSSLAKASIGGQKLDVAVPANTAVGVSGLASVTLNKQTKNKDGSVTVTALEVNVDGIQKIELASVTCAAGDGQGDGTATPTTKPTAPTSPTAPTGTKTSTPAAPTTTGDGSAAPAGDKPDANGNAPVPTPVKSHLDVTG